MHPILSHRERSIVYVGGWLLFGCLLALLVSSASNLGFGLSLVFALPIAVLYGFVCLSAWYFTRAFPLRRGRFTQLTIILLLQSAVIGSFWVGLSTSWRWLLAQTELFPEPNQLVVDLNLLFAIGITLYLFIVAIHYLVVAQEESLDAERRSLESMMHAQGAELRALRAQINPHFLFNSLNSISALIPENPTAAREMTILLSDFFRNSLRLGNREKIALIDELNLVSQYLQIEQIRFGSRLTVIWNIDERLHGVLIPPLLLQPLVENAVKHGISRRIDGGTVWIDAVQQRRTLILSVRNLSIPRESPRRAPGSAWRTSADV
ncbi:MAG: sensor histidine kinase [Ignavibacteria bacterium]|nr:sensor histidine kinase [Ignavibacteria bacterium]